MRVAAVEDEEVLEITKLDFSSIVPFNLFSVSLKLVCPICWKRRRFCYLYLCPYRLIDGGAAASLSFRKLSWSKK